MAARKKATEKVEDVVKATLLVSTYIGGVLRHAGHILSGKVAERAIEKKIATKG